MVKDVKTGECFRADQLFADHMEQLLADPKCPADKKEEYKTALRQVFMRIYDASYAVIGSFPAHMVCVLYRISGNFDVVKVWQILNLNILMK